MRLIFKNKQVDSLMRIITNEAIAKQMLHCDDYATKFKLWTKMMENNAELSFTIGGISGMEFVKNHLFDGEMEE